MDIFPSKFPLLSEAVSQLLAMEERQSGSKALDAGLLDMGNDRLYKIEYLHMLGTPESERLKVTVLNLFHPTASPLFKKLVF